jgi:lipopolysaccharide transport system permease protein
MRVLAEKSEAGTIASILGAAREVASFSELLRTMVIRDLKLRYRNSALGFLWSLLSPLLMMLVFILVFKVLTQSSIENYPVFLMAGLLPWIFTQGAVVGGLHSVTGNANLINKVYFPRELLPLSAVLAGFVQFVAAYVLLMVALLVFGVQLHVTIVFVPLIMLLNLAFALGLAMVVSVVNVFFRDLQHLVEIGMLAWFFLTPIFYTLDVVPNTSFLGLDIHRWVFSLNPMATLVTDYRYALTEGYWPIRHTVVTIAMSGFLLGLGWYLMRRFAHRFAEIV